MKMITFLKPNQVFVFGSNYDGYHAGGAAKFATLWGAKIGQNSGRMGQTYAIVTMDLKSNSFVGWDKVKEQFTEFLKHVKENDELEFLLTPIGTGIAGGKIQDLDLLLNDFVLPKNLIKLW